MHHPRSRHHVNRRIRCASVPVVHSPDESSDQLGRADAVAHLLLPDEVVHIRAEVFGWRWEPAEVTYDRNLLLFGGPVGMTITGIASAIANGRARRRAERAATPAWRSLGPLGVIATDLRLLVWYQQAWWSVWYSAIVAIRSDESFDGFELRFAADPPYRLGGRGTSDLGRVEQVVTLAVCSSKRALTACSR